ncbi:hypothetical protein B7H23_03625 [Notoacmeibacter marinus]|uniref:Uncharacterized protein n=1 Tax=Notoacmeibacter marinus TaxID=1876515 RepID=A0A231V1H6_9HYPH|nr:hypothetical protein [Notoacmeibacter marinus]OXT02032.1 hypothetical protein B7H23_03625 [Notoacmeibacter marinus]
MDEPGRFTIFVIRAVLDVIIYVIVSKVWRGIQKLFWVLLTFDIRYFRREANVGRPSDRVVAWSKVLPFVITTALFLAALLMRTANG